VGTPACRARDESGAQPRVPTSRVPRRVAAPPGAVGGNEADAASALVRMLAAAFLPQAEFNKHQVGELSDVRLAFSRS
jgi:hypothetical protein